MIPRDRLHVLVNCRVGGRQLVPIVNRTLAITVICVGRITCPPLCLIAAFSYLTTSSVESVAHCLLEHLSDNVLTVSASLVIWTAIPNRNIGLRKGVDANVAQVRA